MTTDFCDRHVSRLAHDMYAGAPWMTRMLQMGRPFISPIDRLAAHVQPGSRLLDVGCGAGLFVLSLAANGKVAAAQGLDTSEQAIGAAKEAASRLGEAVPASAGRIRFTRVEPADPLPDGAFDVVSLIDVMHHIPPDAQETFFLQLASKVAPGGTLLYKDMCDMPRWKAWGNRMHDLLLARQWIHYAPLEMVEAWGRDAGLTTVCRDEYSRFYYGHELLVFGRPLYS